MVLYNFNPHTLEAVVGRFLCILDKSALCDKTLTQHNKGVSEAREAMQCVRMVLMFTGRKTWK